MFDTLLVANRGEIARRIIRTARRMGIKTVAVYSEADGELPYVAEADHAVLLGGSAPAESYLDVARILRAAGESGASAVHPGYGFLSERAEFATAVRDAGLIWVGPDPETIRAMGDKINARNTMARAGVPVAPGTSEPVPGVEEALQRADQIGYPIMVKAAAGGGGIGMGIASNESELRRAFTTAQSRAERFFSSPAILLERYIERARHVEIQVFGTADGSIVALGERDCSVQRRHQKIVEETPSPGVSSSLRTRMLEGAVKAAGAVGYRNAGTVECLVDPEADDFVFLEMNTRLQVEHPITEMVTGIDLVEEQLRAAAGLQPLNDFAQIRPTGHAIEFRVYAEDPVKFLPSPGQITVWKEPAGQGVRVDSGYHAGNRLTPHYDPLLAKVCVHGADRESALDRARHALNDFAVEGVKTNLPFFRELLNHPEFISGGYDTKIVNRLTASRR